jgi:uncharacterized membrane protein YgcG
LGLLTAARFGPVKSLVNEALGLYVMSTEPLQLINLGYSYTDLTGKTNSTTPPTNYTAFSVQGRIAAIEGRFQDDPANFSLTYDLSSYRVLAEVFTQDQGPSLFAYSTDADTTRAQRGQGITILVAVPTVTPDPSGAAAPFTPQWVIALYNAGAAHKGGDGPHPLNAGSGSGSGSAGGGGYGGGGGGSTSGGIHTAGTRVF